MPNDPLKEISVAMAAAVGAARRTLMDRPIMAELIEREYQRGGAAAVQALIDGQLNAMQTAYLDLAAQ